MIKKNCSLIIIPGSSCHCHCHFHCYFADPPISKKNKYRCRKNHSCGSMFLLFKQEGGVIRKFEHKKKINKKIRNWWKTLWISNRSHHDWYSLKRKKREDAIKPFDLTKKGSIQPAPLDHKFDVWTNVYWARGIDQRSYPSPKTSWWNLFHQLITKC